MKKQSIFPIPCRMRLQKVPAGMECPVGLTLMDKPLVIGGCGHSMGADLIGGCVTCPVCRGTKASRPVPNVNLKQAIESFVKDLEEKKVIEENLAKQKKSSEPEPQVNSEQKDHVIDIPPEVSATSIVLTNNHLFKLKIRLKEKAILLDVAPEKKISELRERCKTANQLTHSNIRFAVFGKVVSDQQTLADLGVESDSTINAQLIEEQDSQTQAVRSVRG